MVRNSPGQYKKYDKAEKWVGKGVKLFEKGIIKLIRKKSRGKGCLLLFIFAVSMTFLLLSANWFSPQPLPRVWICESTPNGKYHVLPTCQHLARCTSLIETTQDSAVWRNYPPCRRCYPQSPYFFCPVAGKAYHKDRWCKAVKRCKEVRGAPLDSLKKAGFAPCEKCD
jgi:hypothetical protein